jgi:hypothetical protein
MGEEMNPTIEQKLNKFVEWAGEIGNASALYYASYDAASKGLFHKSKRKQSEGRRFDGTLKRRKK